MIAAIETVRSAIERRRPHPGRLRLWIGGRHRGGPAGGWRCFWLPDALIRQTVALLPPASREAIGNRLLQEIGRLAGPICTNPRGSVALGRLARPHLRRGGAAGGLSCPRRSPTRWRAGASWWRRGLARRSQCRGVRVLLLGRDARRARRRPFADAAPGPGGRSTLPPASTGRSGRALTPCRDPVVAGAGGVGDRGCLLGALR